MEGSDRFHEGKEHSHKAQDSSQYGELPEDKQAILMSEIEDERSIANKLERESKREGEVEEKSLETQQVQQDPTLPVCSGLRLLIQGVANHSQARAHGNEPSKGAKIDKEIEDEEAEILKKKGAVGPK